MKLHTNQRVFRETKTIFLNGLFLKNPVLVSALGLYPVVAAGNHLRYAVQLSLMLLLMGLPAGLLLCWLGARLPSWLRPGVVLAVSSVFYLPGVWIAESILPGSQGTLGVYAALMICNSMLLSRLNDYAPVHVGLAVAADAVGCCIGYAVVFCAVAAIREYLQRGSVWNNPAGYFQPADRGTGLPFFGFLLLGFFAAFAQWANQKRARKAKRKAVRE